MDIKIDISNTHLETEHFIIRPWTQDDLLDLFEYASVDGVGEMAGWPHHQNIEITKQILTSFIHEKEVLAIEFKANHKVIGSIGLHQSWANDDENYQAYTVKDIGYVLSKDYWGHGFMPEAVKCIIEYCFHTLHLQAITCGHFETNHQSQRVIEKAGFKFVKTSEYHAVQLGKTFPDKNYILLNKTNL